MAYNEIQVGRFLRYFQKVFSMKGTEPREITLAPEVMPITGLLLGGVEDRYLLGWDTFSRFATANAVAAQNSAFQLTNPAGSNIVAVVEFLMVNEAAADLFRLDHQVAVADLPTLTPAENLGADRSKRGSSLSLSVGNNVGVPATPFGGGQVLANSPYLLIVDENQEVEIQPGRQIRGITNAVNVQLLFMVRWRERFLEESERT